MGIKRNPNRPWKRTIGGTNPFKKPYGGFNTGMDTAGKLRHTSAAVTPSARSDIARQPSGVDIPGKLDTRQTRRSINLHRICTVEAETTTATLIWRFVAKQGAITRFTHYAIFNDGELSADFDFYPRVDGMRVYADHGDPMTGPQQGVPPFRMYLGVAPDLSDLALIRGELPLQPGSVYEWYVVNRSAVDVDMGVRCVGYYDLTQTSEENLIGG